MKNNSITKESNAFYSANELKDARCCLCGEKKPEREFRGLGVCNHCIEYIRTRD